MSTNTVADTLTSIGNWLNDDARSLVLYAKDIEGYLERNALTEDDAAGLRYISQRLREIAAHYKRTEG